MGKENKPKNAFQNDDPDAPDNTISMKIVKLTKNIKGEDRNITRKIYILYTNELMSSMNMLNYVQKNNHIYHITVLQQFQQQRQQQVYVDLLHPFFLITILIYKIKRNLFEIKDQLINY